MNEGRCWQCRQPSATAISGGVGVAGTSGRATTDKTGRSEPMNPDQPEFKTIAQAGSPGEAADIGSEVGILRSRVETPVMGAERRRDTCPGVRSDRGRRLRKEICLHDTKSSTLTHNTGDNVSAELDSESRIREIRSSGLMRGEMAARNRQLRSVQSASFHFAYSTLCSKALVKSNHSSQEIGARIIFPRGDIQTSRNPPGRCSFVRCRWHTGP